MGLTNTKRHECYRTVTRNTVQQVCDADKRRRTSALRDAAIYISIQEAMDAEAWFERNGGEHDQH